MSKPAFIFVVELLQKYVHTSGFRRKWYIPFSYCKSIKVPPGVGGLRSISGVEQTRTSIVHGHLSSFPTTVAPVYPSPTVALGIFGCPGLTWFLYPCHTSEALHMLLFGPKSPSSDLTPTYFYSYSKVWCKCRFFLDRLLEIKFVPPLIPVCLRNTVTNSYPWLAIFCLP